jgi:hypothetical protein
MHFADQFHNTSGERKLEHLQAQPGYLLAKGSILVLTRMSTVTCSSPLITKD